MEYMNQKYQQYIDILKAELIPAMGCTEPIAIAYLASYAKKVLGDVPERIEIAVSGNILKNVKSVIVPNTNHMKGIQAAVAAGIVCGDASLQLEVISRVNPKERTKIKEYIDTHEITVKLSDSSYIFDAFITLYHQNDTVSARIVNYHTNIVYVKKNDEVLIDKECVEAQKDVCDKSCLNVKDIVEFASMVNLDEVKTVLDKQISYNMAIANEGMRNSYGANIGKVLLSTYGDDIKVKAKAMAAAASDARMNGCELPVIILSGSGNQGIAASVPVITYAQEKGFNEEVLYRALIVSDLVSIHMKSGIGRLSAFCGAICAGIGSGAGIAYLETKDFNAVAHTIVNGLGIVSGIVCDGAKSSCAAKIAAAVDAGILGYHMYQENQEFKDGEGLVAKGVENTIANIANLASLGMKEADKEIIRMMVKNC